MENYAAALRAEILREVPPLRARWGDAATVYLGGGTPTVLPVALLTGILGALIAAAGVPVECTVEANPGTVDEPYLARIRAAGANRLSLGVQSFDDRLLHIIGRIHTAAEARAAFGAARAAGFRNISLDLMFGFPEETLDDWQADIMHALRLMPTHISAYGLMYEEGTALYKLREQGKIEEIDEELSLKMYSELTNHLKEAGYEHYEISNFALPGYRSRHNSSYWNNTPYIGMGAAAHSYDTGNEITKQPATRSWNVADIRQYMQTIEQGRRPSEQETIGADTHYNDLVMTALRTCEGISLKMLSSKYRKFLLNNASSYISQGKLVVKNEHLKLTQKGINISNTIMSDLMKV